ncbi:hypothetical protein V8E36_003749 [Tilletia maclaganii]
MSDDSTQNEQAQRATQERQAQQAMLDRQAQHDAEVAAAAAMAAAPRTRSRTGATTATTTSATELGAPVLEPGGPQHHESPTAQTKGKKAGMTMSGAREAVAGQNAGHEPAGSRGSGKTTAHRDRWREVQRLAGREHW